MKDDQTNLPLTVEYIDWVISQVRDSPEQQKQFIKGFERILLQKQKEKRIFILTIDALQEQYHHLQQKQYQVIEKEEIELEQMKRSLSKKRINYQQQKEEQELKYLEKQLQDLRDYAEKRRNKKAKRERQYHEVYHLPLINTQFKKKYMRARDKNNAVEQQLADLHHQMDHIKNNLRQARSMYDQELVNYQKKSDQLELLIQKLKDLQSMLADMKKAQSFWSQFDTLHIQPCLKWVQHQLQFKSNNNYNNNSSYGDNGDDNSEDYFSRYRRRRSSTSSLSIFSFNDWHSFRASIKEYEEAEAYGDKKWNCHHHEQQQWNVTFNCTLCQSSIRSWPYLDKVRANQLLCSSCYHQNRTSMIVEKKLQTFLPKNELSASVATNLTRPNLLFRYSTTQSSSSSSSMVSIPSSFIHSTSKSTHSLINDCKPLMKKMKSALSLNHQKSDPLPHPLVSR